MKNNIVCIKWVKIDSSYVNKLYRVNRIVLTLIDLSV